MARLDATTQSGSNPFGSNPWGPSGLPAFPGVAPDQLSDKKMSDDRASFQDLLMRQLAPFLRGVQRPTGMPANLGSLFNAQAGTTMPAGGGSDTGLEPTLENIPAALRSLLASQAGTGSPFTNMPANMGSLLGSQAGTAGPAANMPAGFGRSDAYGALPPALNPLVKSQTGTDTPFAHMAANMGSILGSLAGPGSPPSQAYGADVRAQRSPLGGQSYASGNDVQAGASPMWPPTSPVGRRYAYGDDFRAGPGGAPSLQPPSYGTDVGLPRSTAPFTNRPPRVTAPFRPRGGNTSLGLY